MMVLGSASKGRTSENATIKIENMLVIYGAIASSRCSAQLSTQCTAITGRRTGLQRKRSLSFGCIFTHCLGFPRNTKAINMSSLTLFARLCSAVLRSAAPCAVRAVHRSLITAAAAPLRLNRVSRRPPYRSFIPIR